MIRPRYSLKLAQTKLHSKRGMLIASILVASLLFAVLIACIVVFTGAEKSAVNFVKEANNDRYLVEVNPVIPIDQTRFSQDLTIEEVREIRAFEEKYYDGIKEKYDKLTIEYDVSSEVSALMPAPWKPESLPEELRVSVNYQSPVISEMLKIKYTEYAQSAKNKLSDLKRIGTQYGADGYYTIRTSGIAGFPNLRLIQNNQENFDSSELDGGDLSLYGYFTNAVRNGMYTFADEQLLQRYLLTGNTEIKGVPVVISAQEAVELFGEGEIGKEPENEAEKSAWLEKVQSKMNGHTYEECYRNNTELAMLEKIQRDYTDTTNNKDHPEYQKPSLQYDYPTEPCGDIPIKEDTRTEAEKGIEATRIENQKKLGTYEAPFHKMLTFQIVGIINAQPYSNYNDSIESYLKNLVAAENQFSSALIPRQLYDSLPQEQKFDALSTSADDPLSAQTSDDFATHVLEFKTINDAREFMSHETCPAFETGCQKLFTAKPFGSNYLILEEIGKLFRNVMVFALPIMLGLAMIIIWFTMSRVMAENRKETAVYRAMGAKRRDIAAIYLTYSMIIALWIAVLSLAVGILAALVVDYIYGDQLTNVAVSSFGTITNNLQFSLFDLSSPLLLVIVVAIFTVSFLAVLYPLIRNVLRPPIDDMRNE